MLIVLKHGGHRVDKVHFIILAKKNVFISYHHRPYDKKKATSPTNLNDADFVVGAPCERGWFDVMHLMSLRSHILFRIPVEYLNIVKCCSKGVD